jgi:superfamily II DNA/RNA helicase
LTRRGLRFSVADHLVCFFSIGKTGSFAIPVLEKVDQTLMKTQALILVPTRELALQTSSVLKKLSKHFSLNIVVSTGGTDLKDDIIRLMKVGRKKKYIGEEP